MNIYIKSIAAISPFSHPAKSPYRNALICADPDLSDLIDPKLTRRMSHVIKMGIGSALAALRESGIQKPDAIITGTAYGCLEDTAIFLKKQIQQHESMLTPTAFIQSTHNTVGGQIGLMLHCNAYNNTFVHRGFSFEHALHDSIMLLEEGDAANVLVGGIDEITPASFAILERFGLFRKNINSFKGAIGGEGAAFFVLSNSPGNSDYAILKNVITVFKPTIEVLQNAIKKLLLENQLNIEDIDVIVEGKNSDAFSDHIYDNVLNPLFENTARVIFKDECGEYPTASGIALHNAAKIANQRMIAVDNKVSEVKYILIYNHYENIQHSIYLLEAC